MNTTLQCCYQPMYNAEKVKWQDLREGIVCIVRICSFKDIHDINVWTNVMKVFIQKTKQAELGGGNFNKMYNTACMHARTTY